MKSKSLPQLLTYPRIFWLLLATKSAVKPGRQIVGDSQATRCGSAIMERQSAATESEAIAKLRAQLEAVLNSSGLALPFEDLTLGEKIGGVCSSIV
jgi:hypothetical protein